MEISTRQFSGRAFCPDEINLIKETITMYPKLSQKELASTVCELIEWTSPNGRPKMEQCLLFLNKLEGEGLFKLPPRREHAPRKGSVVPKHASEGEDNSWMDTREITECNEVSLAIAQRGEALQRWRAYIRAYHAIGDTSFYGPRLYYMVRSDGRDAGCVLFSASSWALAARDEWIGWTIADKKARLHLVLNNSRLLILPWVHVKNLGSRILSLAARQVVRDWMDVYFYEPVLLESFVETPRYHGTVYKASNWTYLGETQGRGRNDRWHSERLLTRKAIYVYPLMKDFRQILTGAKPCKERDPDVF